MSKSADSAGDCSGVTSPSEVLMPQSILTSLLKKTGVAFGRAFRVKCTTVLESGFSLSHSSGDLPV